jgi:dimethylamine monooxygenase subunit A
MGRSDQSPPDWLDELPLDPGASVHAMGTRTLEPERWLQTLAGDDARRSEKQHILERHHDDVVGVLDGFTRPVQQAVEEIARRVGLDPVDRSLEDVSMATAEDLCVLSPVDARWVLVGGAVCFPSMWRLPDKLGLSIGRVHDPVPRYAEELEVRVDRFFDRMPLLRPVWRRNWFVHDVPDLFLPRPIHHDEPVEVPDGLWLR